MNNYINAEVIDILRLKRSTNVSNITFFKLIEHFGSAAKALEAIPHMGIKSKKGAFKLCSKETALKEIEACKKHNIEIISYKDLTYPILLHQVEDRPPLLFVRGNKDLLSKVAVTIVGSRNPSLNGMKLARNIAKNIGDMGLLTVSGLALGIDTEVHKASLETGTAAFLGSGVNVIYPKENTGLYHKIVEKGIVLSEFQVNEAPAAYNFPKRNRLLSGIASGVIVVEAGVKSGSLITAKFAVEQNRDVFAFPSSPYDNKNHGTNKLLKEGAILIENINDIMDYIVKWTTDTKFLQEDFQEIMPKTINQTIYQETGGVAAKIMQLLDTTPIAVDILTRELDYNNILITTALLELELSGEIVRLPGNKIIAIKEN